MTHDMTKLRIKVNIKYVSMLIRRDHFEGIFQIRAQVEQLRILRRFRRLLLIWSTWVSLNNTVTFAIINQV